MRIIIIYSNILISIILFVIGYYFNQFNIILSSILILILNNIIYIIKDLGNRAVFFFFNLSFFTFLIGGIFFEMLSGQSWWVDYSTEVNLHVLLSIFLSLFSLFMGMVMSEYVNKGKKSKNNFKQRIKALENINIQKTSKVMFYLTYIVLIITLLEKSLYVLQNGYVSLYTDYATHLPSFILKIAETNKIFLFIYLSTLPKKKDARNVVLLNLAYLILTIFTGVRNTFVVGLFVLLTYAIFRDAKFSEIDVKWIGKYEKIVIIVGLPFLIAFLNLYGSIRSNATVQDFSFFDQIINFFKTQGASINVLYYGKEYENLLPTTNTSYTFGPLITYFTRGTFASIVTGLDQIKNNTVEMAIYGNNFGATITYLVNPQYYLSGGGLGTQYIAELYADFGYLGIIIFNFILGCIFIWIPRVAFNKWWTFAIGISICYDIYLMPRSFALTFIGTFMSLTTWLPIILVVLITKFINKMSATR